MENKPAAESKIFQNAAKDGNFYMGCVALDVKLANHSANVVHPHGEILLYNALLLGFGIGQSPKLTWLPTSVSWRKI